MKKVRDIGRIIRGSGSASGSASSKEPAEWEKLRPLSEKGSERIFEDYVETLVSESTRADFIQNPLATAFFEQYQDDDPEMALALNLNRTREFYQYILFKIRHREPVNLSVFGTQRGGKSGVATDLALIHSRLTGVRFPVNAERILKNQSAFLRFLPLTRDNELYIIDEQKIGHTQIGGWAAEWEIEDFNKITAKRSISEIWICPDLIDRGGEYGLKVLGLDRKKRMAKCLIFDLRNSEDETYKIFGFTAVRHYDPTINEIKPELLIKIPDSRLRFPALLRKNYELKKDKQIEELSLRYNNDRNLFRLDIALRLSKDELFAKAKNTVERKVVARTLLPDALVEEEIEEIIKLSANPEFLLLLIERVKKDKKHKRSDFLKSDDGFNE